MEDIIITAGLGVIITALGFSHRKGNIASLHSYHRKRVTEENRLPFGKMIGLGTIIIGVSLIVFSVLEFAAEQLQNSCYSAAGNIVLIAGLAIGLIISFYAMIKYNKGIF